LKESKMHLFCITRGEQSAVRNCMHDLSAQFFEGKVTPELLKYFPQLKGAETKMMQMIVQPIQLWSLVFPEENLAVVQKTIHTNDFSRYHSKDGNPNSKPYVRDSAAVFALRKMLRAKKCPPIPDGTNWRVIRKEGVEFLPIGIKGDSYSSGFEGL